MINGIASWISLFDLLFLVHENARNFSVFDLYTAILPNLLMNSRIFLMTPFIFYVQYHVICKQWYFYLFNFNLDIFYFFCLSGYCG